MQHLSCTSNLHLAMCHPEQQETARGASANCNEAFMERDIRDMRELLLYRLTSCPEKLYVNSRLMDGALTP